MLKLSHCTCLLAFGFILTGCATVSDVGTYVPTTTDDFYTPALSDNQPAKANYISSRESDGHYINAAHTANQRNVNHPLSPDYD